ncbi:hypothetical protein Tco_0783575 [Tanacetum coccineum]
MEEYNHQISFRADSLPITKISYVVNSRKEETMKITKGLVIKEPELGIFYMNWNMDVVFQKENEFHLTPTVELIRIQNQIKVNSEITSEMYRSMNYVIEARDDCIKARKTGEIVGSIQCPDSEVMKGLSECEASKSNARRIQVKDIVKEVEDYLKKYSSAGMDISWYVEGIR